MRILALGDSYTIGEGVPPEERWPVLLANRLRESGLNVADPVIIARTGWTTDELAQGIDAAQPSGPFDMVTLLIGVNNQYRGRDLEEYRAQFLDLLRRSIFLAGERADRVLVLSIPDWGVSPFAAPRGAAACRQIGAQIDAFNQANHAESQAVGAQYVDITPITRAMSGEAGWLVEDGLHPSGKMYAAWVEEVLGKQAPGQSGTQAPGE